MKILALCPHYAPDVAPTGEVMTAVAEAVADLGHTFHLVTALPWYRDHRVEPGWGGRLVRADVDRVGRISRVHPFPTDKGNLVARALAFGGFTALAGLVALFDRVRPDVVFAMSPPLTLGPAGWAVARARRVPFVFNVQDIFPDVAVELGMLTNPKVIGAARALERFVYRHADAVTVLSDDLADNVGSKLDPGADRTKVRVIPNFVDTERVRVASRHNAYRDEFGLGDATVVMYAGNVGFSQSLDLVVDAARVFADRPDVVFVINGGGSARAGLERRAAGLRNLRFVDMQPRERLSEVLAAADLHVVPLKSGLARSSVPSKLYSILASGRPVLASVDAGTEVARTVERAGAGLAVGPEDSDAFVAALTDLVTSRARLDALGRSGRRFVEGWASPAAVGAAYADLFAELASRRRGRRAG
ncbi:MAG: glycosyltransferase family 4 protein [Acidimicrobiia bacterium]|nr:glycosyltransferase family 4 protein [Acidimicrobiia bacterium]